MSGRYPGGRSFAFTIFDDTDVATVENVKPIYDLLASLGMRTTKTVWPFAWSGGESKFSQSETLDDPHYLAFVCALAEDGFEIASHGATMESSDRDITLRAHERLKALFGAYPRAYASHAQNRENMYWGPDRIDQSWLRWLYGKYLRTSADYYQGHVPGSRYWWGDACAERHAYVRNLTFNALNALEVNPSMPYFDPRRPLVQHWFSATDAEDSDEFVARFAGDGAARLERDGGLCIVATHLGKRFVRQGRVDPRVEAILRDLARRNGWFVPVSTMLDWLVAQRPATDAVHRPLPRGEWRRLQTRWARDLLLRRLRASAQRLFR